MWWRGSCIEGGLTGVVSLADASKHSGGAAIGIYKRRSCPDIVLYFASTLPRICADIDLVVWRLMRTRNIVVAGAAGLLLLAELTLLVSGERLLVSQTLVRPGESYAVANFGDVGKSAQASLVCRYFTGRSVTTNVLWYSSNNVMGRDECPTFSRQESGRADADGSSSLADWVSGIGSMLAVIVALAGYGLIEWQRRNDDKQRRQGAAYQIGYKLSTLSSEAHTIRKTLFGEMLTEAQWAAMTDPFQLCGTQPPMIGFESVLARDLNDYEQNLLMALREEEFLMNFSETFARNSSIHDGMVEFSRRSDEIKSRFPPPSLVNGQVLSIDLTDKEKNALLPLVIPAATLLISLREMANLNVQMLAEMGDGFRPMMQKHYPDLHVHKIDLVKPS